jgi:hypothetical protein
MDQRPRLLRNATARFQSQTAHGGVSVTESRDTTRTRVTDVALWPTIVAGTQEPPQPHAEFNSKASPERTSMPPSPGRVCH